MNDPSIASALGASLAIMGIPVDALVAGLFGGLVSILSMPPRCTRSLAGLGLGTVLMSVACAGFLGPVTAGWINMPWIEDRLELLGLSFLWGAGAETLLPTAIESMRRRIAQLGGPMR